MRSLNPRERTLALLFGAVIFGLANLIVLPRLRGWGRSLQEQRADLEGRALGAESWLGQKELWKQRGQWLATQQPVWTSELTPAVLVDKIRRYSADHGVLVLEQNFVELPATPAYSPIALRLRLSGPFAGMISWLYDLQQPDNFILCQSFSCGAQGDDASAMTWEITLAQLFRPKPAAATAPALTP
jgi:hypothetical protein